MSKQATKHTHLHYILYIEYINHTSVQVRRKCTRVLLLKCTAHTEDLFDDVEQLVRFGRGPRLERELVLLVDRPRRCCMT